MLTLQDCVDFCDLGEEEIMAIAEHEHVPEIIAAEMADYIIHTPDGVPMIHRFILDDIEEAKEKGDFEHADKLKQILLHFVAKHPEIGTLAT